MDDWVYKFNAMSQNQIRFAAEKGDREAQYHFGALGIVNKLDNEKDNREGLSWVKKSADQGFVEAQYFLGVLYAEGNNARQDFTLAAKYLQKAVDKGHSDAKNILAFLYRNGQGVEQDVEKALELWGQACDEGVSQACNNYKTKGRSFIARLLFTD